MTKPPREAKKPDKQTVAELLKEIDLTSDIVSEEETKKLKELDHILSESPELKNMSMDEIIGMLNISEDDKKSLTEQVNQIISNEKLPMSEEDIQKEFPGIEKESVEVIKALDDEISKNPDFRRDFFAWTQQVQQSLGPNMEKLKTLGEDELARIATPPDDLRAVLDRIMPNVEGIESAMRMDAKDIWKDEESGEDVEIEEIKIKLGVCWRNERKTEIEQTVRCQIQRNTQWEERSVI